MKIGDTQNSPTDEDLQNIEDAPAVPSWSATLIAKGTTLKSQVQDIGQKVGKSAIQLTKSGAVKAGEQLRSISAASNEQLERLREQLIEHRGNVKQRSELFSDWFNAAIGDRNFVKGLDSWMRGAFAAGPASIYDRAMDSNYIATHIGGGYHRLFDGGHDLVSAWKACREAGGNSITEDVKGYVHALWKDLVTPMGLPVFTVDQVKFHELSARLTDSFGISPVWLKDAISVTATELIGSVTAVLAMSLNWSINDRHKFAGLVGSYGVSTLASANPLLAIVTLVCLARAFQQARIAEDRGRVISSAVRGG
ncbi:MAG TPA: hypothetical protein VIH45_01105, partial [Desulfuromonadaceae bacterium]